MDFLCAEEEPSLMVRDLPPDEAGSLSREQILSLAAREMQHWGREQYTQRHASSANKVLILCGVALLALLIFLCGYVVGQHASDLSLTGSSPARVHETIKQ